MLDDFLKSAQNKSKGLNVGNLMNNEEKLQWEILVKAMDSIDIMHIGDSLEKISKTYQLKKWQEMSILAYVKILEMMVKAAKDNSPESFKSISEHKPELEKEQEKYNGSMFG